MKKTRIAATVLLALSLTTPLLAFTQDGPRSSREKRKQRDSLIVRIIKALGDVPTPPIPPPAPKP